MIFTTAYGAGLGLRTLDDLTILAIRDRVERDKKGLTMETTPSLQELYEEMTNTAGELDHDLKALKALIREFLAECIDWYADNEVYNALYERLSAAVVERSGL